MAFLLFANEAQTTLALPVNSLQTNITVASGTARFFPQPLANQAFKLTISSAINPLLNEIVLVTSITGDVMTVARGQEGTLARAWNVGDFATNLMTAGTANALVQIEALNEGIYSASLVDLAVSDTATINNLIVNQPIVGTASKVENQGQVTTNSAFFVPFISGNLTQGYNLNSNNELFFNPNAGTLQSPLINAPAGVGGGIF